MLPLALCRGQGVHQTTHRKNEALPHSVSLHLRLEKFYSMQYWYVSIGNPFPQTGQYLLYNAHKNGFLHDWDNIFPPQFHL